MSIPLYALFEVDVPYSVNTALLYPTNNVKPRADKDLPEVVVTQIGTLDAVAV